MPAPPSSAKPAVPAKEKPARKATPAARPGDAKRTAPEPASITPDERRVLIAQAAYFRAEKRGFAPGGEERDWLEAELEVDALLAVAVPTPAPAPRARRPAARSARDTASS